MDIYCPRCGEPVELDYLHDVAADHDSTFDVVRREFFNEGCVALDMTCSKPATRVDRSFGLTPQVASEALYDLLGDDVDGIAAMMEDMGF